MQKELLVNILFFFFLNKSQIIFNFFNVKITLDISFSLGSKVKVSKILSVGSSVTKAIYANISIIMLIYKKNWTLVNYKFFFLIATQSN